MKIDQMFAGQILSFQGPETCSTVDGQVKPQRLLKTAKADLVTVASFQTAEDYGTLPQQLKKRRSKENELVFIGHFILGVDQ